MRHQPSYRIVAIDSRKSRDGEYLEALGNYNPRSKELHIAKDRVDYWLSKGAQPSDTAKRLIKRHSNASERAPVPESPAAAIEPPEAAAEAVNPGPAPDVDTAPVDRSNGGG